MPTVTCGTLVSSPVLCSTSPEAGGHFSSCTSEIYQHGSRVLLKTCTEFSNSLVTNGMRSSSSGKGISKSITIVSRRPVCARAAALPGLPTTGAPWSKERCSSVKVLSSLIAPSTGRSILSAEQKVYEVVAKQASMFKEQRNREPSHGQKVMASPELLAEAYARCGEVCAEYAKTFYLGTTLMTPERQQAIWAIYVFCVYRDDVQADGYVICLQFLEPYRGRTDELVDGPNASRITPTALDRWEERLEDIFRGQPYDMLDAALADTVARFPVDIQPFRDMVDGMRMDLVKSRYSTFDELYLYCYNVAGTVGLMSVPVMGIASDSKASTESVYSAALALGIADQLTNILRDVGEDALRQRVYLPQDELHRFGLSDEDIFAGVVTDKWRAFMKDQIHRARMFFKEAEDGVRELDKDSRWPVWAALILYRQILDAIEANDYNNFTKRAYVGKVKKFVSLPAAYGRALVPPPSTIPSLMSAS